MIGVNGFMRDELENTKSTQKNSIHRKIGLGIYIIFALIYYFFMKDRFLDGPFFLIVGIALLLIIIFKFFKDHTYDFQVIAVCMYFLIFGSVHILQLSPLILVVAGIVLVIVTIFPHSRSVKKG
jgi:hypothetical protein